jgi:hypothetical protein
MSNVVGLANASGSRLADQNESAQPVAEFAPHQSPRLDGSHATRRDRALRDILKRMRHDGCGGRLGRSELLTGIEGASSRPVRRILLIDG